MLVLAQAGALIGLLERAPVSVWVATAVAVAAVLGLMVDVWAGALLGLAAAVGVVAVRRATGSWTPSEFTAAALETLVVVAVGAVAGRAGTALRKGHGATRVASAAGAQYEPAHGSLGLLGEHAAMARLQEEVARGERQLRPVTLVLFEVVSTDATLTEPARQAACRAVARVVESRAGEHDIPFALSLDRLGIVFPDTTLGAVWDVVGRVLASVSTATFTDGDGRTPRPLTSAVDVLVGISRQARAGSTAATMVADATTALARARVEEAAS
ncbi:hypothetical protein [Nocardioides aurantiacus]|uniref:hypothetical protein n=1 Tax=Nocardioides aurantiacus TaxID=86796 RepID=UPI00403F48D2